MRDNPSCSISHAPASLPRLVMCFKAFIPGQKAEAPTLLSALWLGFLKREYLSNP